MKAEGEMTRGKGKREGKRNIIGLLTLTLYHAIKKEKKKERDAPWQTLGGKKRGEKKKGVSPAPLSVFALRGRGGSVKKERGKAGQYLNQVLEKKGGGNEKGRRQRCLFLTSPVQKGVLRQKGKRGEEGRGVTSALSFGGGGEKGEGDRTFPALLARYATVKMAGKDERRRGEKKKRGGIGDKTAPIREIYTGEKGEG